MAHAVAPFSCKSAEPTKIIVVAIEFGTRYSGYACSLKYEYEYNPLKIHMCDLKNTTSCRTPTTILLNSDLTFNSFGYEAEEKYTQLLEEDGHHDYHYFMDFQKMFYNSRNMKPAMMMIEDSNGCKVKALTVFAISIEYFKAHMVKRIMSLKLDLHEDDIYWILIVSKERSTEFMREAAEMAGIKRENHDIVLKPEAAISLCAHLQMDIRGHSMYTPEHLAGSMRGPLLTKSANCAVVDAGSETVHISMYEFVDDGHLLELGHAKDLECGSKNVDAAFEKFWKDIVGPDAFDDLKRHQLEYTTLYEQVNTIKRTMQTNTAGKQNILIPCTWREFLRGQGKTLNDRLKKMIEFDDFMPVVIGDKIQLDVDIIKSFFKEPCRNVVKYVREVLEHNISNMHTILLVGEFAESKMLQDAFRETFSDKTIIIPNDADLAVLKGAVLYGHHPFTTIRRRSLYSWK